MVPILRFFFGYWNFEIDPLIGFSSHRQLMGGGLDANDGQFYGKLACLKVGFKSLLFTL